MTCSLCAIQVLGSVSLIASGTWFTFKGQLGCYPEPDPAIQKVCRIGSNAVHYISRGMV
jgi:hypothetical protein